MILEILLAYLIVVLSVVLSVGSINIYYFFNYFLKKENRLKLFKVWLLTIWALSFHSIAHIVEIILQIDLLYTVLELMSLLIGVFVMSILARDTLSLYTVVETRKSLEKELETHAKYLEFANKELQKEIDKHKKTEKTLRDKIEELEKWQKLSVDREMKMIELKEENKELKKELKGKK